MLPREKPPSYASPMIAWIKVGKEERKKNKDKKKKRKEERQAQTRLPARLPLCSAQRQRCHCSPSSQVELEGLVAAPDCGTPGTFPSSALLADEDFDSCLAEAADALGAGIRLLQRRHALACRTVDLGVLRRVARGRI